MPSYPAYQLKGGDVVVLNGRHLEVFDVKVTGNTAAIRVDGGRSGVRTVRVDADQRIAVA